MSLTKAIHELAIAADERTGNKLRGAVARMDAWVNEITGFGTYLDKTIYGGVVPDRRLSDTELSALYHGSDMAARMVDAPVNEMLREGFTVETGDEELDALIKERLDYLEARDKFADGLRWGRCYGGAGLIMGADDGREASEPLIPEEADDLRYLYPVDRRQLWPLDYYTKFGSPRFGQPRTYMITAYGGPAAEVSVIHESRLILFGGAKTGIMEKQLYASWDMSVLQRAFGVLRQFDSAWKAVEVMLTDGNQSVLKMSGLAELIRKNGLEALQTRLRVMELYRSVMRALVVDAEGGESLERQSVNFTNIPETLDKIMLRLSAAVEIPVTILMGQSPAGMNATGESDFRWFYDRCRADQTRILAPRIHRAVDVMLRSRKWAERATKARRLEVKFPALWQETPVESATRRKSIIDADAILITSQQMTPEEVALIRLSPGGYDKEILLDPQARKAREALVQSDLAALEAGKPVGGGVDGDGELPPGETPEVDAGGDNQDDERRQRTLAQYESDRTALADDMTKHGVRKCEHGYTNRCQYCGVERVRSLVAGENGEHAWAVKWRAVGVPRMDAKPFELWRDEDESGVSGTGVVAEGVVFKDGTVAMRWLTKMRSTTTFESIEDVEKIHGHGGKSRIVYTDEPDAERAGPST